MLGQLLSSRRDAGIPRPILPRGARTRQPCTTRGAREVQVRRRDGTAARNGPDADADVCRRAAVYRPAARHHPPQAVGDGTATCGPARPADQDRQPAPFRQFPRKGMGSARCAAASRCRWCCSTSTISSCTTTRWATLAGDACLRKVAAALQSHALRPTDIAARYGGEEFVLLFAETGADTAVKLAESVRAHVESLELPQPTFEHVGLADGERGRGDHRAEPARRHGVVLRGSRPRHVPGQGSRPQPRRCRTFVTRKPGMDAHDNGAIIAASLH